MNKKVTLSLLSATVFASMAASAFAAPTQGVYMGGSVDKFYKLDDLFNLTAEAKKQFVTNLNTANPDGDFNNLVFVDFDGKGAKFSEILAKGTLSKAKRDLIKTDFEGSYVTVNLDGSNGVSYDPRNDAVDVPTGDLKVESVSAITTTVKKAADQQLGIQVNGNRTVTVDELKAAGYSVEFLFNFSATPTEKTTGVVNASNRTTFKYAVKVTKGEETFTSQWTDVKVVDATQAVEVTKVGLKSGAENWALDYITVSDTNVAFAATEAVNALGETENVTLPNVEKVTSSDVTVAYYANGVIKALKPGTVTFTVKFTGVEKTVAVPVVIKAAQEATSVVENGTTIKVKANAATDVNFTVNDQYSEKLRKNSTLTVKVIDKDGNETSTNVTAVAGKGTIAGFNKAAGEYTVKVLNGTNEIGSFTIKAVDLTAATPDKFELSVADKAQIDLKDALENPPAANLTINISAFADEVKLTGEDLTNAVTGLKVESSNKDVVVAPADALTGATFTVTGGTKTGVATVSLVKVEEDYKETLATIDVEVVNTTPQIDALNLKEGETKVTFSGEEITKADVVAALTAGKDQEGNEVLTTDKIEAVTYVEFDEKVIVEIKAIYGGKTFVFDAGKVEQPGNGGEQPGNGGQETIPFTATIDGVTLTLTFGDTTELNIGDIAASIDEGTVAGTVADNFTGDNNNELVITFADTIEITSTIVVSIGNAPDAKVYEVTYDGEAGAWVVKEVNTEEEQA
ncbi:hypothetical protein P4479_16985 [Brevibacillus agri]|uniref:hypothetical protein n=1 Tax=Brevibacillus agri TaxID=51101 RepID=UPI002E1B0A3B|nr:hypothetical protein [Brevibacillus agri]